MTQLDLSHAEKHVSKRSLPNTAVFASGPRLLVKGSLCGLKMRFFLDE